MQTITLSEAAVAVLRFEVRGWKAKRKGSRLPAYRELAAAGIMEPLPGSDTDYRFTEQGYTRREEILREEEDRIESARFEPPDASEVSDAARTLLQQIATGRRVEMSTGNRPAFRELAEARIIYLMHTFAGGAESGYRVTLLGWEQRFEIQGCAKESARSGAGMAAAE